MEGDDDDNEALSFISLGAATLNVIRYLINEQKINGPHEEGRTTDEHQKEDVDSELAVGVVNKRRSSS